MESCWPIFQITQLFIGLEESWAISPISIPVLIQDAAEGIAGRHHIFEARRHRYRFFVEFILRNGFFCCGASDR